MTKEKVQVSSRFKMQMIKVMLAIGLFAVTYIVLLSGAIMLTGKAILFGIDLVQESPNFFAVVLGLGIVTFCALVLFFLIKFVFSKNQQDKSMLIEITPSDQPELFEMINELVAEIGTDHPQKVYLSHDVNAGVFYESGFWTMFMAPKLNLMIGMGVLTSVTKGELRGILAHEFGHFSQKSMKYGGYVYNVNRVIFNLLHENQSFGKVVDGVIRFSGPFAFFVLIGVWLIQIIQWILTRFYGLINLTHMKLSREMEFHADEISIHIAGNEQVERSMTRMPYIDFSFQNVLQFYNQRMFEGLQSENLYANQSHVIQQIAKANKLKMTNGFPDVNLDDLNRFNKSKLVIENQWDTHPSLEDRIAHINKVQVQVDMDNKPAISSLRDVLTIQKELTARVFKEVKYKVETSVIANEKFVELYDEEIARQTLSEIYNGFYEDRVMVEFNMKEVDGQESNDRLEDLFSSKNVHLLYDGMHLQGDIDVINQIQARNIPVKTFDYDGKRYKRRNCFKLLNEITPESDRLADEVQDLDRRIYLYFRKLENVSFEESTLVKKYENLFKYSEIFHNQNMLFFELSNGLEFINYSIPNEQVIAQFNQLSPLESKLRSEIRHILKDESYADALNDEFRKAFELYVKKSWRYFNERGYEESNLEILLNAVSYFSQVTFKRFFRVKKDVLDYQVELTKKVESPVSIS